MKINYRIGDATELYEEGPKILMHVCNNIGLWGKGFVLAISRKWSNPEKSYRSKKIYSLGHVTFVEVEPDFYVANMIAQVGVRSRSNRRPLSYEALSSCLSQVNTFSKQIGATIHAPRIGSGLAGGKWSQIESLIEDLIENQVYIYDLERRK